MSTTIEWPVTLPAPLLAVSAQTKARNLRTVMESGRVRNRRMASAPREMWEVVWNFTEDQYSIFKSFFEIDLDNGALNFDAVILPTSATWAFLDAKYTYSRSDNLFAVSAILELISSGWVDLELTVAGATVGLIPWGTTKSYTFTLRNLGRVDALFTVLEIDLSDYFSFISATGGLVRDSSNILVVALGTIPFGTDYVFVVTFACNGGEGSVTSTGIVTTASDDIALLNNSVTVVEEINIAVPHAFDTFEDYTAAADLANLNGGQPATRWAAGYASRAYFYLVPDTFETYTAGVDLGGLNGSTSWDAAYVSRTSFLVVPDNFETYTAAANLDGLNGGTNWDAAYVSR